MYVVFVSIINVCNWLIKGTQGILPSVQRKNKAVQDSAAF